MGVFSKLQAAYRAFRRPDSDSKDRPEPPGHFSFGTNLQGGPRFTDPFKSRPAPSLTQLIENYGSLIYAMASRSRNAVTRRPMRLLMDGSKGQGGPPGRACDPIKISRDAGQQLAKSGQISTAAVDQVYEVRNHPLLDVLDKPDPYGNFSRKKLIGLMVSYFDVVGSGYLVPEGNGWDWRNPTERAKGPPEYLWVIYPQYTIPYRGAGTPIVQHFQYFADRIPLNGCLWFKHNLSLRDPYGSAYGPTQAGESYRRQEQEFNALFSQVMALGPRPNMIATAKDAMIGVGKHEADALKIDLIRQQSGGYAGGVLVNTGAFDFTPASYQPADLAGKELSEYDIYALAAIFDQPATYYTINSNLANLQAADKQYDENGVQPRCDTIADTFTALAKTFDPRLSFRFDPGLAEDQLIKAQVDKIYVDMGAITLNQLNEEKKFPPVPWGDEPWLPGTLQQPSMMTATHEAALKTADQAVDSAGQKDDLAVKGHKEAADQQDHQQSMDKANLEVDKKAASKPAPKRSLEDELDSMIGEIRTELEVTRKAGNPNHVPSGAHGGEFTSGSGGGSAAGKRAPGKHHAKNARKAAKKKLKKPAKPSDKPAAHAPGSKAALDRAKKGKPAAYKSDKAELAAKNAKPTTKEVQDYTKQNEYTWAERLKHKYKDSEAFPDNGPVDVQLTVRGRTRGIEMKTLVQGENDKVTMSGTKKGKEKESALRRKVNWQEEHGAVVDTIVDDHRNRYKGGEHKHLYSGGEDAEAVYYKRGTGSFRINAMHRVKDQAELERLLETPYHQLPKKAQGDRRGNHDESYLERKK